MKRILMLNTLPIINFDRENKKKKTAGNQTLYNTLKGYSDNNISVTMITFYDLPKTDTPFPNIVVKRSIFYGFFNFLLKTKSKITGIFLKRKESITPTTEINRTGSTVFFKFWEKAGYIEGLFYAWIIKPDIIYGYEIYSTKPAKKIADKLGLPVVSRFQGTELGFFIDEDSKFKNATCYIKGTEVNTDLVIMANDGTDGDKVLEKLNIDPSKMRFWVNGLHNKEEYINYSKDKNYRAKMDIPEDAFIICTANRFVDWKRIDRIIKVMGELEKINSKFYLVAIGDGPEKAALNELVKSLNLKNVIFTGALEHKDAINHIANSDLYITLNHSGNLGNSILEALALGTVVCTLKNDSVENVLTDGFNSVLFTTTNEKTIANKLINLISDESRLEILKNNARLYAQKSLLSWPDRMKLEISEVEKLIEK